MQLELPFRHPNGGDLVEETPEEIEADFNSFLDSLVAAEDQGIEADPDPDPDDEVPW